jgi:hypothetical protein
MRVQTEGAFLNLTKLSEAMESGIKQYETKNDEKTIYRHSR